MPPRKVLFVEDEAALQYSYERVFQGKYAMAYAPNGAEAMRQLNNFEPDVLVLDMRLPDTDGIALLQRIRETWPTLPVVVTTAYVSMEPLMNVLDLGHSRYLVKPYELSELAAAIDAAGCAAAASLRCRDGSRRRRLQRTARPDARGLWSQRGREDHAPQSTRRPHPAAGRPRTSRRRPARHRLDRPSAPALRPADRSRESAVLGFALRRATAPRSTPPTGSRRARRSAGARPVARSHPARRDRARTGA